MMIIFYVTIGLAVVSMLVGLALAISVVRVAPGGTVGRTSKILLALIVLFTVGYFVAPFMPYLPAQAAFLLTSVVFLFGALYVILVLWLIRGLIKKVLDDLNI